MQRIDIQDIEDIEDSQDAEGRGQGGLYWK